MTEPFLQIHEVGDTLDEVGRLQEELASLWESRGLSPEAEGPASLALEELLSNVLRHGRTEQGSRQVRVEFLVDSEGFEFEVSDNCAAYNPLARPDPDVTLSLAQRVPGGLGVFMVKRLADELHYKRSDGRNHIRFRKRFATPAVD